MSRNRTLNHKPEKECHKKDIGEQKGAQKVSPLDSESSDLPGSSFNRRTVLSSYSNSAFFTPPRWAGSTRAGIPTIGGGGGEGNVEILLAANTKIQKTEKSSA